MKTAVLLAIAGLFLATAPAVAQSDTFALYVPFDDVTLASSGAANVTLNGSAVINSPGMSLIVKQDTSSGKATGIIAHMQLQGGVTLEISADASGSFSQTLPLAWLPLPPMVFSPTVIVTPVAVVSASVSGEAAAGLRTSFVQEFDTLAQLSIGPGFHASVGSEPVIQRAGPPEIASGLGGHVEVSTTLAVVFLVEISGIPFGGPEAGITLGIDTSIDPLADPWWEIDGVATPFCGYWGIGVAPIFFPGATVDIVDAGGPLPLTVPQTRWSVALDAGGAETARGLLPTPDGFRIAGVSDLADELQIQIAPDGALLSTQISSWSVSGLGQNAVASEPASDGGSWVGGNNTSGPRIDRLDAAGTMVWSKFFTHDLAILPLLTDIAAREDGGCAILGRSVLSVSGLSTPFVARLDADGQVLWVRDLVLGPSNPFTSPLDLATTADGGLLLAGSATYSESQGGLPALSLPNLLLAKLDGDGNLVFCKVFGGTGIESGRCVAEAADGTLWVGGSIIEGPSIYGWLGSFAADGTTRWTMKLHGDDPDFPSNLVVSVRPLTGGVQLLGERGIGPAHDAWLALVTNAGTPLAWKTIGAAAEDTPVGLRLLSDGLVAWGWTLSLDALGLGASYDPWVLRTSVDGMLHFDAGNGFDATNDKVIWGQPSSVMVDATLLSPTSVPATFTASDVPLPFSPLVAVETVLSE